MTQMYGNTQSETSKVANRRQACLFQCSQYWMLQSLKQFSYHNSSLLFGMLGEDMGEDISNENDGRYFMFLDFPQSESMAMTR